MSNNIFSGEPEESTSRVPINDLLYRLRSKLQNFALMDNRGHVIGRVESLFLDPERQLNLVASFSTANAEPRAFLVNSRLIQDIDPTTHSISVDISDSEVKNLPEYSSSSVEASPMQTDQTGAATPRFIEPELLESPSAATSAEEVIRLLEERLVVNRSKRKVGEVIVRKEIETRIVEVPVRREKLVVEQISPEHKQIAEIDLGKGEITGVELAQLAEQVVSHAKPAKAATSAKPTVSGEFASPRAASLLLDAIALQRLHGCAKVRVEIELEDPQYQKTYQEWLDRCSG